jgi:hypothetical protein
MELLPALRAIRRRRLSLALGLLGALAVLFVMGGTKPVTTPNAVAWTEVALDTPQSQLATVSAAGADTLPWRASLLTHLMATDASTRQLARELGVGADQVIVVDPALETPLVTTSMAQAAATAASGAVAPYTLTMFVENTSLPLISIEAAAPHSAGAKRLADAAIAVLESQASPAGRFSSGIPTGGKDYRRQPFVIEQVAPVRVKLLPATAAPVKAIAGSLAFFLLWCAGVLLVPRLSRAVRGQRATLRPA